VSFKLKVKNIPYYLHGKYHYDDIMTMLDIGGKTIPFGLILREGEYQTTDNIQYTLLYDEEKNQIDIKVSDDRKTIINNFEMRLLQRQIEKAKNLIKEKVC
jgi:hypothetical protein